MANESIIIKLKDSIMDALCLDEDINSFIDSEKYNGEKLKFTHIFPYNKNPNTITETSTFITVTVNARSRDINKTFVTPILTIIIYSHCDHMNLYNPFKKKNEDYNRNDYLGYLITEKFNGTTEYGGIGKLQLVSDEEYPATEKFLARKLVFETVDINASMCNRW